MKKPANTRLPKDKFFEKLERQGLAVTFADVRLKTGYTEVMPDQVDTTTYFSRNIPLKIPIVSAAMDKVTEHALAIELAKLGGLGIIHRNLSPKDQAFEVAKVKFHLNPLIDNPITYTISDKLEDILRRNAEKGFAFQTFPIIDPNGKLAGMLTGHDIDFCENNDLPAGEIMTPLSQLVTGKPGTTIDQAYTIMVSSKVKVLPLLQDDGILHGIYIFSDVKRVKQGIPKTYNVDKEGRLLVGAAIGVGKDALESLDLLLKKSIDVVVIDTAHADTKLVIDTIAAIRHDFKNYDFDLVAGNVSQPASARRLAKAGVDGIKVGQGPGSICTTRMVAGIGCPQVSAVYACAKAIGYRIPICADGGIEFSGDIPIIIGAGASSCMIGSVFAGTDESPGEIIHTARGPVKEYRGMGSIGAMESSQSARQRYNQSDTGKGDLIAEGVEGQVPYKGPLRKIIFQFVGGLKRGMGYVGAASIKELIQKADFDMISDAGKKESHPHGITITKEAPNYKTL